METPSPTEAGRPGTDVPKRGCLRKMLIGLVAIVVTLFLLLTVLSSLDGSPVFLDFIVACLLGWIVYLICVIPQITVNYASVATGLIAFVLAVAGLHRLLSVLAAANETRPPWRWRWTVCIALMIPVMFGISVAAAGLVHQTIWLMREPRWTKEYRSSRMTKNTNNARQLLTVLRIWASDHDGTYPDRLTQLFTDGVLNDNRIFYYVPTEYGTPELLVYLHGSTYSTEDDVPVVIAPRPTSRGGWVVATNEFRIAEAKMEQFEELMARWRAREALKKAPAK